MLHFLIIKKTFTEKLIKIYSSKVLLLYRKIYCNGIKNLYSLPIASGTAFQAQGDTRRAPPTKPQVALVNLLWLTPRQAGRLLSNRVRV